MSGDNFSAGLENVQFPARIVDNYDKQHSMLLLTTQSSLLERISDISSLQLMQQPSGPLDMVCRDSGLKLMQLTPVLLVSSNLSVQFTGNSLTGYRRRRECLIVR